MEREPQEMGLVEPHLGRADRSLYPPGGVGCTARLQHMDRHIAVGPVEDNVMTDYETHDVDVLVIGAGGAGLRAAVEASRLGVRTGLVCKSVLGKAHTVMAQGGMAAALPYCDEFLSGHSARSMVEVVEALAAQRDGRDTTRISAVGRP